MKILITVIFLFGALGLTAQTYEESILAYQDTLNMEFANPDESPLTPKALKKFKGLKFFPINEKYRVIAKVKRTPEAQPFQMKTSTSRLADYRKFADLVFEIDGESFSLEVYQNLRMLDDPEYHDYLFLPFTDLTNGESSYGGGRYISLSIPDGETMEIDFNKAYNPYCAYSSRYSCPIVPRQNRLLTNIEAGVKKPKKK